MNVVLLPNCAFLSEVSRMIEIYRALTKLNIPAVIATHGGTYEFIFRQEGIDYDKIPPLFSNETCLQYLEIVRDGGKREVFSKENIIDQVRNEITYFTKNQATIVISGFTLSSKLSASACGITLLVTHLGSFIPIAFEKKFFTFYEYFHNQFTNYIPKKWIDHLGYLLLSKVKGPVHVYNAAANYLGIESVHSMMDLLMGDYTLITDVPEILQISEKEVNEWNPKKSKLYRPNARLSYVGPIFARLFEKIPEDVQNFLNTHKPSIYVAMNSGLGKDMEIVYQTIADMDISAIICSTVHKKDFSYTPNILIRNFLPSHLIMPYCDLAIINGGQGTVQTAIASGIPIIGFPLQPEQNFNLMQIQRHGGGICMSLYDLRRGKLEKEIRNVLRHPEFKSSMKKLMKWQSRRDGALETAKLTKQLLK